MIPYAAHCADRRRRSGAHTSITEVERSRTGRRSVRAQWRTPQRGNPTVTQNWLQTKKQEALNYQASHFINKCGRWDLNPHARNEHKILSLARLPIPTLPHSDTK